VIIYTPFLKLKKNELQGIIGLTEDVVRSIRPFFDVPRTSKDPSEGQIIERLRLGKNELRKALEAHPYLSYYVDNFDLNDEVSLQGSTQYSFILDYLEDCDPIPVIALNRSPDHNATAIGFATNRSRTVALRLQRDDIESFRLSKPALLSLWRSMTGLIDHVHVFLDFRVINDETEAESLGTAFLRSFLKEFGATSVSVTSSSIPANISQLIKTNSQLEYERPEMKLWANLKEDEDFSNLLFGDYAVVSPDYSDAELDPRILRQVSTPKVFYPFGYSFLATRGLSLDKHGNEQYFDIADVIVAKPYFRGNTFSIGDKYIFDRSYQSPAKPPKAGHQGSWIKAMTALHLTFVSNSIRGIT